MTSAVTESLTNRLQPGDEAVAELALTYALAIDCNELVDLDKIGGRLLACLVELGLTPRARAAILKGGKDERPDGSTSPLDELRERRRSRQHRAEAVDAVAAGADA